MLPVGSSSDWLGVQEHTAAFLEQLSSGTTLTLSATRPSGKNSDSEIERINKVCSRMILFLHSVSWGMSGCALLPLRLAHTLLGVPLVCAVQTHGPVPTFWYACAGLATAKYSPSSTGAWHAVSAAC